MSIGKKFLAILMLLSISTQVKSGSFDDGFPDFEVGDKVKCSFPGLPHQYEFELNMKKFDWNGLSFLVDAYVVTGDERKKLDRDNDAGRVFEKASDKAWVFVFSFQNLKIYIYPDGKSKFCKYDDEDRKVKRIPGLWKHDPTDNGDGAEGSE